MKKTILAMMVTALVATAAVGCTEQTESKNEQPATENKSQENSPTTTPAASEGDAVSTGGLPESNDTTHKEIKDAFQLDGYKVLSMMALTGIAMGNSEMPLDQNQALALAKAINQGMAAADWKQGEPEPGIFVNGDGSSFGIGLKRASGELQLELYDAQADGTYKSVKKETKPGK